MDLPGIELTHGLCIHTNLGLFDHQRIGLHDPCVPNRKYPSDSNRNKRTPRLSHTFVGMFFILSKLINFLFMPLSWVLITLALSFFWKRKAKLLRIGALAILLFFGNSFILHEVNLLWEVPVLQDDELKPHRVGVVLGGYAYYSPENDRITFRSSADRLMQGYRLYQTGMINNLILSGGSGYVMQPDLRESRYVGDYMDDISFPKLNLIIEDSSRNTYENAVQTAAILQQRGWDKQTIVLITSAYHMRRAKACFEKQGISVIPYPAEPWTGERMFYLDHLLLPSAEALAGWNVLIHEWVGFISYRVLGYA